MSLDQEAKRNFAQEKIADKQIVEEFEEELAEASEPIAPTNLLRLDFSFLLKKTGAGSVDSPLYMDHPMNSKHSKGRARFLRGCTGIAGDLDLAIIDIALGGIEMFVEKRSENVTD